LNEDLRRRRESLVRYMVKGLSIKDVAVELTKTIADPVEKEKQLCAIKRDWSRREDWLNDVVRCLDGTFLAELVAGMNEATSRAWFEYASGDSSSARVGALRTIIFGKARIADVLIKAGGLRVQPQRVEVPVTLPWLCDPEMKKSLLAETERQRLEKEGQDA